MTCRDFGGMLEGLLDGTLDFDGHARCVRHAAFCPSCREIVEPMGHALVPVAKEPPPWFLSAVLAKTSGATSPFRITERPGWAETWRRFMLRPRFAAEAAYVGVVALCLARAASPGGLTMRALVESAEGRTAEVVGLARAVLDDVHSEAGNLLDRATSLLEKEKP